MIKDAEAHAEEDKSVARRPRARNLGESLVFSTEKFLAESGDKVDAELRGPVDTALADLREAIKGRLGRVRRGHQRQGQHSSRASQKMGAAMYAAQAEGRRRRRLRRVRTPPRLRPRTATTTSSTPRWSRTTRTQVTARHNHHGDEASAEPGGRDEFDPRRRGRAGRCGEHRSGQRGVASAQAGATAPGAEASGATASAASAESVATATGARTQRVNRDAGGPTARRPATPQCRVRQLQAPCRPRSRAHPGARRA